ncbi:MAG: PfkB family carbohydrate kinase, partial [Ilumatobacteraceae bacterium]
MLCVIGDLVEDVVVRLPSAPARGTDTPAVVGRSRGGSAGNVSAAAAAAGAAVRFVGRVGEDAIGAALVDSLRGEGVDVCVQRAGRTGTIVVLVEPGGERTMLPDRGAAGELGPVDPSWLAGVSWLHVPAYSLCTEPIGSSTLGAVQRVRSSGGQVSIDVSSVAVVAAFGVARFARLIGAIEPAIVFANAEEAELVAGLDVPLLVVKDGGRPVRLHRAGAVATVAVPPVEPLLDTPGAGDAVAGGFLAATLA